MLEAPSAHYFDLESPGTGETPSPFPLRYGLGRHSKTLGEWRKAPKMLDHIVNGVHPLSLSMLSLAVKHPERPLSYRSLMETAGDRLRKLRELRGLSLAQASAVIGISPQALSMIETGATKNAKPAHFLALCAFYDVDPYRVALGRSKGELATELRSRHSRSA